MQNRNNIDDGDNDHNSSGIPFRVRMAENVGKHVNEQYYIEADQHCRDHKESNVAPAADGAHQQCARDGHSSRLEKWGAKVKISCTDANFLVQNVSFRDTRDYGQAVAAARQLSTWANRLVEIKL